MSELRLEFPQLDKLVEMVDALQKRVDEVAKWVRPDSFVQSPAHYDGTPGRRICHRSCNGRPYIRAKLYTGTGRQSRG